MDQTLYNAVLGIAGFLSVFVLAAVWARLGKLEVSDTALAEKIAAMHILVAGEYVKRVEIEPKLNSIYDEIKELRHDMSRRREGYEG